MDSAPEKGNLAGISDSAFSTYIDVIWDGNKKELIPAPRSHTWFCDDNSKHIFGTLVKCQGSHSL